MGSANLEVFSETLQKLAENDTQITVVTSDSRGSGKLVPFGQKFPEQMLPNISNKMVKIGYKGWLQKIQLQNKTDG